MSCVTNRSIILGARAKGDWTRALYHYAFTEQGRIACENGDKVEAVRVPVHVMIDGPYGGCSLDLGEFENVLLFAGGAGATFTLGLLDDLVGRIVRHQRRRGEPTRRVEFAWAIRSVGEHLVERNYYPETLLNYLQNIFSGSRLCLQISRTQWPIRHSTFISQSL